MIILRNLEFEWDEGNIDKIRKRFTIVEVEKFFDQKLFVIEDTIHSTMENRLIATGSGPKDKPMFVCGLFQRDL